MSTDDPPPLRGSFVSTLAPLKGGMSDEERADLAAAELRWRERQDRPQGQKIVGPTTGYVVPISVP
jgi:hypothetical protein